MAGPDLDSILDGDTEPIEDIKQEDLPTLNKNEYDFLNKMINKKD